MTNGNGTVVEGVYLDALPRVAFQGQVTPRFAVSFSGGAIVPLAHAAEIGVQAKATASAGMLIAFETWDFVAGGSVVNPTQSAATTLLLGIRKRWGL